MPGKYGFGNSRKKSPFKLKGMDFGVGTGSSPLNKTSRADRRIARAVEKGNVEKAARISARQAKKGKTKVAPTATPINDASMKNYNKAVDARTSNKGKAGTKIDAPKPQADKSKVVAKPTVKKEIKKVPTKRGTGVTYKAAWEADKGGVQGKYKDYAAFEKAAKAYNKKKDIEKGYIRKEGTKGPTQPYPGDKK